MREFLIYDCDLWLIYDLFCFITVNGFYCCAVFTSCPITFGGCDLSLEFFVLVLVHAVPGLASAPDHKFGRAHLKNVASRWAKLKFWKIDFLQLFHSKSGALYAKTPHFCAAFSALHLSSTHLGPRWETRTPDILLPNFWIKIFLLFPTLYSRFCFIMDALRNSWLHCFRTLHGCL